MFVILGSGTESDSDESVPELEEQDSTQAATQQAQVGILLTVSSTRGKEATREPGYLEP